MKTQSPRILAALALLSLGTTLAPGCDAGPDEGYADSDIEPIGDQAMLRLGAIDLDGPLALLEGEFDVFEEVDADLDESILDGVQVLAISLAEADDEQVAGWTKLAKAAMDRKMNIVLEGATGEQMAEAIGFGLDATAVAVTQAPTGNIRLTVLPDEASNFVDPQLDLSAAPSDEEIDLAELIPPTAEDFLDELGDALHIENPGFRSGSIEGYRYYLVNMVTSQSSMDGSQIVTSDVDFEAELALDVTTNRKVLQVKPVGPGVNVGSLSSDSKYNRGHFLANLRLEFFPFSNGGNIELYAHAPETPSSTTTYTSSTGWSVGYKGTDPSVTYSQADQESTTLSDFSVVNSTVGKHVKWDFGLTQAWNDMYEYPVFQRCRVKGIPSVAKSTLAPKSEAVYRALDTYDGTVGMRMYMLVTMRKLTAGGWPNCSKSHYDKFVSKSLNLYVNFGDVDPIATTDDLLGTYDRLPVANNWHTGTITEIGDGNLRWTNNAGVSWVLTPDFDEGKLFTGPDCPYYTVSGGDAFTLEFSGGEVTGFWFQHEFYTLD